MSLFSSLSLIAFLCLSSSNAKTGNYLRAFEIYEFPFSPAEENKIRAPCLAMDLKRDRLWMLGVGPGSNNRYNRIWSLKTDFFDKAPRRNLDAAITDHGTSATDLYCFTGSVAYSPSRDLIYHLSNGGALISFNVVTETFNSVSQSPQTFNGPCVSITNDERYLIAVYHQWGYNPLTIIYDILTNTWTYGPDDPNGFSYAPCALDKDKNYLYRVSYGAVLKKLYVGDIPELSKGEGSLWQWQVVDINRRGDLDSLPVSAMSHTQMTYMNGQLLFGGSQYAALPGALTFDIQSGKYFMGPAWSQTKYWIGWAANSNLNKVYAVGGAISTLQVVDTFFRVSNLLCPDRIVDQYGPNLGVCSKAICRQNGGSHTCIAGKYGVYWSDGRNLGCPNAFAIQAGWCSIVKCNACGSTRQCVRLCKRDVRSYGLVGVDCRKECNSVKGSFKCWAPELCRPT